MFSYVHSVFPADLSSTDINWDRSGEKIEGFIKWSEKQLLKREVDLELKQSR